MSKSVSYLRKIIVALVGVPLLVVGIILIPVPGPGGLPVCLAALFILSLEFDWAKSYLVRAKTEIKKITDAAKDRQKH